MEVAVILSTTDNHIQTGSLQYGVFINDCMHGNALQTSICSVVT